MDWLKIVKKKGFLFAFHENKKVGYLKYSYPQDDSKKRNMNINYVYVDLKYRRRGIAKELIKRFMVLAKERGCVWVDLWTSKDIELMKATKMYRKLGFKEIAHQKDYYCDGVATRLFVKRLRD
ncbi:GNAT family N-acetyltransferase [Candidatus Pacearchaeota archaeon]|nr:GNAT family N-acetyltransferase [Candidatus Pacearchaeota archaeon]